MKILILHPNLTERGGAERKVLLLTNHLKKEGHTVKILVFRYNKETCFGSLFLMKTLFFVTLQAFGLSFLFWFQFFES